MRTNTKAAGAPPVAETRAPHHRTPVEMTGLWARAIGYVALSVLFALAGIVGWIATGAWQAFGVGLLFAVLFGVPGAILALYTKLEHVAAYGNAQPKAKRAGDVWRIHLKREIPVADRGTVDMDADVIDLPVAPREFTRIVREMMRNGTSRDRRPAGVSQPLHAKIMRTLEDLDGATNGGPGVGWKLADDLDALLSDIEKW